MFGARLIEADLPRLLQFRIDGGLRRWAVHGRRRWWVAGVANAARWQAVGTLKRLFHVTLANLLWCFVDTKFCGVYWLRFLRFRRLLLCL